MKQPKKKARGKNGGDAAKAHPQQTFTEAEVKDLEDFINFVYLRLAGSLPVKDMFAFYQLYTKAVRHSKICREHIMEFLYSQGKDE